MVSTNDLRREIARRKKLLEKRNKQLRAKEENKKLKRELVELKYGRALGVARTFGRGVKVIAKGVSEDIQKANAKSSKKKKKKPGYYFPSGNPFNIKAPRF